MRFVIRGAAQRLPFGPEKFPGFGLCWPGRLLLRFGAPALERGFIPVGRPPWPGLVKLLLARPNAPGSEDLRDFQGAPGLRLPPEDGNFRNFEPGPPLPLGRPPGCCDSERRQGASDFGLMGRSYSES